jgi:hypothetical protein
MRISGGNAERIDGEKCEIIVVGWSLGILKMDLVCCCCY